MATRKKAGRKAPTRKKKTGRPKGAKDKKPRKRPLPGGGRPRLLTESLISEMCGYIREGNYIETAANMVGVSKASVFAWMKEGHAARRATERGDEPDPKHALSLLFLDSIKRAEAEAEVENMKALRLMAGEAWQSIAWRLERRHPDRWGRRQAIEHSSPDDKPVKVQRVVMGDVEIEF